MIKEADKVEETLFVCFYHKVQLFGDQEYFKNQRESQINKTLNKAYLKSCIGENSSKSN